MNKPADNSRSSCIAFIQCNRPDLYKWPGEAGEGGQKKLCSNTVYHWLFSMTGLKAWSLS